jgi:hypothetical protein
MLQTALAIVRVESVPRKHGVDSFDEPRKGRAQEDEGSGHEPQVVDMHCNEAACMNPFSEEEPSRLPGMTRDSRA